MNTISNTEPRPRTADPTIKIDSELHRRLKIKAAVDGTTVGALATKALKTLLATEENKNEAQG